MATSGDTPFILCTPCFLDNKTVAAIKYCVNCNDNLCKPCIRQHIKSNPNTEHSLIGKNERPEWMPATEQEPEIEEQCSRHPEIPLDQFCHDHNLIICSECLSLEHSSCQDSCTLLEAAIKATNDTLTVNGVNLAVKETVKDLKELREECLKYRSTTRQQTAESLATIRDFRARVNAIFDELQKIPIERINTKCIEEDTNVDGNVKTIEDKIASLTECVKQLKSNDGTAVKRFSVLRDGQTLVKSTESYRNHLGLNKENTSNCFMIDPKLESFLKSLKSIGHFTSTAVSRLELTHLNDIEIAKEIAAESEPQLKTRDITSTCVLNDADGKIIIIDKENKELVLLDSSLNVNRTINLHENGSNACGEPFAVCSINETDIAVTFTRDKLVKIYSIQDMAEIKSVVEVGEYCRGIAYSALYDEFYIGCGGGSYSAEGIGHIRVYNSEGTLLRSLTKSADGKQLTPRPMNVAVSHDGSLVIVADLFRGFVTFDRQGMQLSVINIPEMEGACDVCVDIRENVIVCCSQSRNVIQIARDRKTCFVLLGENVFEELPSTVVYDTKQAHLLITMSLNNSVKLYSVK